MIRSSETRPAAVRLCASAILFAVLALLALFALAGLTRFAYLSTGNGKSEWITFVSVPLSCSLLSLLCALLCALLLRRVFGRFARALPVAAALWAAATIWLVLMLRTGQIYDAAKVLEAATLFAQGNYKAMLTEYFNACSYQLGLCLPMEFAARLLPGLNLNLFMQVANVLLSVLTAFALCAFAREALGTPGAGCAALFVLLLPAPLVCTAVYGTLPMLAAVSLSLLCYARYVRTRRARFGLAYALLLAIGYMLKPNAAIALIALTLCAALDALSRRSVRPLLYALLAIALSVGLARAAIWQYELRSGVTLRPDVSMLARLTMGLQEGGGAAGWFNCYIESFFSFDVTQAQQRETALLDLTARLGQMREDPAMALSFFAEKLLSQWLEPTYGTQWAGALSAHTGPLSQAAQAAFAEGSAVRAALTACMRASQLLLYALSCAGLLRLLRRGAGALEAALPLIVLGGALYHLIFEAKSQYAYVYAVLLVPLAAHGLEALLSRAQKRLSRMRARA